MRTDRERGEHGNPLLLIAELRVNSRNEIEPTT